MQYVMKILIAIGMTVGFAILCTGVKRLCKKAISEKLNKEDT